MHNDYFVSMCEKADDLMDRCILAETQEDLSAALRFCDGALGEALHINRYSRTSCLKSLSVSFIVLFNKFDAQVVWS